jgi:predicted ATP-grasp superfamily ATP-dependent carboligase
MLPVVITAADVRVGLGLARALRGLGVPIYGLASDMNSPCCRSSAWTEIEARAGDPEHGLVDSLLKLAARHPEQVLFPAEDDDVDLVSRHRDVLTRHYRLVLPGHSTVRLLGDKSAFAAWARENRFPIPRTQVVSSPDELDAALDGMTFPVVLKPAFKSRQWLGAGGKKMHYRLNSRGTVAEMPYGLFGAADRYVVQEWIDGGDSDVHFCLVYRDRSGRELAYQTGRKLVQWPIATGNTALCTTTDDPALHRLTERLFDRAGHVGLGSLEVKRDARDGEYYITEPTVGRPNLQSNLALAAGLNLAVVAYHDACGTSVATEPPRRRNALWMNERNLPAALVVAARHRQLDVVEIVRALVRCRAMGFAYGAAGDLRPLLAGLARRLHAPARLLTRSRGATTIRPE